VNLAGAASVAKRFRIPSIVIGLTIVAFGTSAPELTVILVAKIIILEVVMSKTIRMFAMFNEK